MHRSHHFGDRGQALIDLGQPGRSERGHALANRALPQGLWRSILDQQSLDGVADPQYLEYADPPMEPAMRAEGAAGPPLKDDPMATEQVIEHELLPRRLVHPRTPGPDPAHPAPLPPAAPV